MYPSRQRPCARAHSATSRSEDDGEASDGVVILQLDEDPPPVCCSPRAVDFVAPDCLVTSSDTRDEVSGYVRQGLCYAQWFPWDGTCQAMGAFDRPKDARLLGAEWVGVQVV